MKRGDVVYYNLPKLGWTRCLVAKVTPDEPRSPLVYLQVPGRTRLLRLHESVVLRSTYTRLQEAMF
jgi:hypothetical protein